ncbi:hypothetical protein HDV01_005460 [Terramyces sp. JEL0728]|nr:hypothetical protein HDV01_005460 [Terramyces sp. JEL0728]
MSGRQDNAYVTPSAVILGLAVHELVGALYLLVTKYRTAKMTPIWLVAAVTFVFLVLFVTFQIAVLDFITAPYPSPTWYFGVLILLNYLFNLCCTFGVGIMLLIRLRAFYGGSSVFQIAVFIALFVFSFKTLGNAYGIVNAKDIFNLQFLNYYDDPVYKLYTFLKTSYVTAVDIIESQLNDSKNSRKDSNLASLPRKSILRKPISQLPLKNTLQEYIQPAPPRSYQAQPITSYISTQDVYVDYDAQERDSEFVSLQKDSAYREPTPRDSVFVVRESQDFSSMARESLAFKRAQDSQVKETVSPTTLLSEFIDTVPSPAYF